MRKYIIGLLAAAGVPLFSGCDIISEKTADISIIYLAAAILSLALFAVYFPVARKKNIWYILLFASITVVNFGYYGLSVSQTIESALTANRISYLGSVFLPLAMLMIILDVIGAKYKKSLPIGLAVLGVIVFIIAASPGYSDIYYKEVFLGIENGVTVLEKVYGDWHILYMFYLLGYFAAMVSAAIYATAKSKVNSVGAAVMLNIAVFVNLGVWLIEQFVHIDFEILSVSYIISEMFLLGLNVMLWETEKNTAAPQPDQDIYVPAENTPEMAPAASHDGSESAISATQLEVFASGISILTPTEKTIFEHYIEGASSKDIMAQLNIKENTLKYHNKNIYGKLGVSSRKQLLEIYRRLNAE